MEVYIYTLHFKEGKLALLNVYKAKSQEDADDTVTHLLPNCEYTFEHGDHSGGYVHCFCTYACPAGAVR